MTTRSLPAPSSRAARQPAFTTAPAAHVLRVALLLATLCATPAGSQDIAAPAAPSAAPAACESATPDPTIAALQAKLASNPDDLEIEFELAAAWSAAGCFSNAVHELELARDAHPGNPQVTTRLRAARSLLGAEHFFDHLDRAGAAARLRQASARCTDQHELDACDDALRLKPDDPPLLVAQGDALVRAKRPADALEHYRLAAVLAPGENEVAAKLAAAEGQLPPAATDTADAAAPTPGAAPHAATPTPAASQAPLRAAGAHAGAGTRGSERRYSNAAPAAQSH